MPQPTPPNPPPSQLADPRALANSEDVLTLHEERVVVSRRRVPTQLVRATRTTLRHSHRIEELLCHERVVVERVPIGQIVQAVPAPREEGDVMILPVVEERLVLQKQLFLKEEVRIRRVKVTEQHVETVTLREQEVAITRSKLDTNATDREASGSPINQPD